MDDFNGRFILGPKIQKKLREIIEIEFTNIADEIDAVAKKLEKQEKQRAEKNDLVMKEVELLIEYSAWFKENKSLAPYQDSLAPYQDFWYNKIKILGALESEIGVFIESLGMMRAAKARASLNFVFRSILDKIKLLSRRLWQLLLPLLNLKEWSIAGDAGINVLGLSGGVRLQFKFGK